MPRKVIRVGLMDDKSMTYDTLEKKIRHIPGVQLTFFATSQESMIDLLDQLRNKGKAYLPHIILMDIQMPGDDNGYECTAWLRIHYPDIRVIGYSNYHHPETVQRMLLAGACAFIEKGKGSEPLRLALKDVYENGHHTNEYVTENVLAKLEGEDALQGIEKLTPNHLSILLLWCCDLSPQLIAAELNVSLRSYWTLRKQMADLFKKETNEAILAQAFLHGLMPDSIPEKLRQRAAVIKGKSP